MTFFLTCFAKGDDYIHSMNRMVDSFRKFHDEPVLTGTFPDDRTSSWGVRTLFKPVWLRRAWMIGQEPVMLWVDADARFTRRIEIPTFEGPVACMKFSRWSTGTMVFQQLVDRSPTPFLDAWAIKAGWQEHANDEEALESLINREHAPTRNFEWPDPPAVLPRSFSSTIDHAEEPPAILHGLASQGRWLP